MQKDITLRCGRTVGNSPSSNNIREDVLKVLDRLHVLWSISDDYGPLFQKVSGMPPGSRVSEADLEGLAKALVRNEDATLSAPVATRFLNRDIRSSIGFRQQNEYLDFINAQNALTALGFLSDGDRIKERQDIDRIFKDKRVKDETLYPCTLKAITDLKVAIVSGNFGWLPVRASEMDCDGDRFLLQTYENDDFSIFVPSGYRAAQDTLRVHVFFSPGGASGSRVRKPPAHINELLTHNLRAAFDPGDWVLIGVPGDPDFPVLTAGRLEACLERAGVLSLAGGKKKDVSALRLSAYSAGTAGLRKTLTQNTNTLPFPISKIERIYILDDESPTVYEVLRGLSFPEEKVTFYRATGVYKNLDARRKADAKKYTMPRSSSRLGYDLAETIQAVGYARAILDGIATHPRVKDSIPGSVQKAVNDLGLPPLGCLCSLKTASNPCHKIFGTFIKEKKSQIQALVKLKADLKKTMDDNDLLWYSFRFSEGQDTHHFWLCEFAHELIE